ncbi:glycosyltransferase family 39 protein [Candidatus Roizmanbacteria bacterium]|nr:glycosyltransferase family 39 protein [Candidatus Roizmanbacteria bacterium]
MVKNTKIGKLFIIFLVFIFSFSLRLWNLNEMGRTWDEVAYVERGYRLVELVRRGDFTNSYWYEWPDNPPLARYVYGIFGSFDIDHFFPGGQPVFKYDYTFARLASSAASSLSVILVLLMGWKYVSLVVGIIAAIILSTLPFFLGLSQLATLESFIMLFFTASVYALLNFLDKSSKKNLIVAGIMLGLALQTKFTNFLLIPLFIWIYLIWFIYNNKKKGKFSNKKGAFIFSIAFFIFFLLWPMPWFHLPDVAKSIYELRVTTTAHSIPEVFFGRLMFVPKIYYFIQLLITTPLVILLLLLAGFKRISDKRTWIMYSLIAWFLISFVLSFYNLRQHGVRYIIQIYAPLSLIAAIGFDYIVGKFTKKQFVKLLCFIPILIYMIIILFKISPYYLDYFNGVVGGTKGVYEKRMFQLGWWGQGLREAGLFLTENAPKGSKLGIAVSQTSVIPPLPNLNVSEYKSGESYDYVMVNHYHVIRDKFNDTEIKLKYKPIYNVIADGAYLVTIYKSN